MSDEADFPELSYDRIIQLTALSLAHTDMFLMIARWTGFGQTAANSAMGQYVISSAKLAGVKT